MSTVGHRQPDGQVESRRSTSDMTGRRGFIALVRVNEGIAVTAPTVPAVLQYNIASRAMALCEVFLQGRLHRLGSRLDHSLDHRGSLIRQDIGNPNNCAYQVALAKHLN